MRKIRRNAKRQIAAIRAGAHDMVCLSLNNGFIAQPVAPEHIGRVFDLHLSDSDLRHLEDACGYDTRPYQLRVHSNLWFRFRVA
jgi:hypothetical protein